MVHGDFARGDYFIDCSTSLFVSRAIFGAWITFCVAVVALCVRFVYRSKIAAQLLANKSQVSLWHVAPATNILEVFELRHILARAIPGGDYFYAFASIICIASAILSAASTTIANHAIVENAVLRTTLVQGRLVTSEHTSIEDAAANITARVAVLDRADAPLEQLFDFVPDDSSGWVFIADEWNNTWLGSCTYVVHPAVDLVVFPTRSSNFQDEVPLLGLYLPQWATVNRTSQGTSYSGFYTNVMLNGSGSWRDLIVNYVFGTVAPGFITNPYSRINISFANYLAHDVARDPNTTYLQTAFKSDVHVADCTFDNATPGAEDQAFGQDGDYTDAAAGISSVFARSLVDTSIAQQPVIQPTGPNMVRYWQAYSSVKDAQYPHVVSRRLSVVRRVVQIRFSVLVATLVAFLLAVTAAAVSRSWRGKRLRLPDSQLAWIVQAVREHQRGSNPAPTACSPATYSAQHVNHRLFAVLGLDGMPMTWIEAASNPITEREVY